MSFVTFLRGLCVVVAIGIALVVFRSHPLAQTCANAIVCENALPGNPSSEWDIVGAGDSTLQGFATDISVNKGGTVHFKVTTTAAQFQIDIYRLGYYGGMGARKIATLPNVAGRNQVPCLTNNQTFLVDCGNWSESTSWLVPANAVSGIYIAKLTRFDTGGASHIVFVVRDDASTSDILMQTSDTTWQAYNQYGGFSLYQGSPQRAYKVSYNRPFATRSQTGGFGPSNWVFYAEYPTVRWLESNGYDVTYFTGLDSDRNGALIRNHKAFFSIGHDEYWSAPQRANVEAARAAGVHLAFMSGNEMFWKVRWETSIDGSNTPYRTLVSYKETHANAVIDPADPPTWTGTWWDPRFSPPADGGRPQNALSGQLFTVNRGSAAITVPAAYANLRFWRNTSIAQLSGAQVATLANQTLGYEWDQDADNGARPPGIIEMSSTTVNATEVFVDFGNTVAPATVTHNLTLYRHASGALVFGAGTVQWVWGLDPHHDTGPDTGSATADLNIQQATMNLIGDMGIQPQTRQPSLFPATPTTDLSPPASVITSPAGGGSIPAGTIVTIAGTASDTGGGVVGGVEVSTDGGATWHRAAGTQSWTYAWTPGVPGAANIRSRAVDDSGNLETAAPATAVTIAPANCPCSLWNNSVVPWNVDENDANAIEVGTKFRSDVNGQITGLRFYKSPNNTGTHTGHLWTGTGTLLGSLTFTNESASGWQQASFATPVSIAAGTTYVASYHTNTGHYSVNSFYFGRSGFDEWPLHALADGVDGPNAVFNYGTASTFPTQTFQAENYWVDVVLGPVDTTPPTVSMTAPANGATVTGSNVTVSATAADNTGVAGVQFKLDGANLGAEVTASPYTISWNSTVAGNGTHNLTAVARDASANTTTSAPVTVTVSNPDTIPPTVSMTAPAGGAIVAGTVSVSANASDNNGVIGVQFLLDGASLGAEVTSSPYSISWNAATAANGTHSLAARARDAAGNQTTSTAVSVTVANGAPLIDVSVSADKSNANSTIASPAFSTTTGNELLLAFIAADDVAGGNTVTGVTGASLTWQLVRRTNVQRGMSEIWRAFASAALTNVSVTATLSQGASASLTVVTFKNVDTSGANGSGAIGATGSGNANPGAPAATLTTTRANSWVLGVGNDWDSAVARTPGANQPMVHQYLATNGDTFWVQRANGPTAVSGTTVTINDTAPAGDRYNLTICEVLPPGAPTWSISGTISPAASGSGATITLSGAASATMTADASGNFTFGGLVNGAYTLTPSKSGFTFTPASQSVTVSGANVTGVAFTAQPVPTWSISGTISPAASGSSATLTLSGGASATTTADAAGNFTFTGLANGTYTVTPSKNGFTFTPANQPVTVSGANVAGVNFTASAAAAQPLSIDATVFTDQGSSSTSVTSPAFSTTAGNELLLAFIAADYLVGANTTVTGVTGAGLTWQLVARTNVQSGTSEIWRAFAPAALINVSVTATVSQSAVSSLTVVSFKGVDSSGVNGSGAIGAIGSANAASGAPTATLTTTRNNSWVFGVGNDYDNAIARSAGANQTLVHQDLTPTGDTYWVQRTTSTTPLSGTVVTLNDTAPTGDRYNLTICEILPPLQ